MRDKISAVNAQAIAESIAARATYAPVRVAQIADPKKSEAEEIDAAKKCNASLRVFDELIAQKNRPAHGIEVAKALQGIEEAYAAANKTSLPLPPVADIPLKAASVKVKKPITAILADGTKLE